MALNTFTKFLRLKDAVKLLSINAKCITSKNTLATLVAHSKVSRAYYQTIQKQNLINSQIKTVSSRFYSTSSLEKEVSEYRNENNVTIIGDDIPVPYINIENCEFPSYIKEYLKEQGFTKPTVIQSQGWPIAISGQNFVGIAQTGTGKTLAYLLPAAVHLTENKSRKGRGPRALVLAPTRELARQIEDVAKTFERKFNIRCACIYGGANRDRQARILESGVDLVIATPGRLNDFLVSKTTNLARCTYVVLDEADRMLDMGFEPQIRQALEGVPLERQILMFSATWPKEVKILAKDYLGEFVQVNVGSTELTANHNIKQHIHVCEQEDKLQTFKNIMHQISGEGFGKVLVFTNTKRFVDNLADALRTNGWPAQGIHGDKSQTQRDRIIHKFKNSNTSILVATDVAARGLDVDGITHVINYDFPNTSEDYIHRIGRTGRQDHKGVAHTLLTHDEGRLADSLIAVLKEANQEVPEELEELARSYHSDKALERKYKANNNRKYSFGNNYNNNYNSNYNNNYSSRRPYKKNNTNKQWNSRYRESLY